MLIRDRRAEHLLAQLDPADLPDSTGAATAEQRAAMLQQIQAKGRAAPGRTVRPRRLVLAATALIAAVAAAIVVRPEPAPVYAATPPMLRYVLSPDAPPASELLTRIAEAAERSPTRGTGVYEFVHVKYWQLEHPLLTKSKRWSVEPGETWHWRHSGDASGRTISTVPGAQHTVEGTHGPGQARGYPLCRRDQMPPDRPLPDCPIEGLTDRETLLQVLSIDGQTRSFNLTGQLSPLGVTALIAQYRVLPPAVRAALWRFFADLPGVWYTGRVTDRAGRTGEAFSMDFDAKTGPARDTLIVDPDSGELLGFERTLNRVTDPSFFTELSPMEIRTPAVVSYTIVVTSEHRESATS